MGDRLLFLQAAAMHLLSHLIQAFNNRLYKCATKFQLGEREREKEIQHPLTKNLNIKNVWCVAILSPKLWLIFNWI